MVKRPGHPEQKRRNAFAACTCCGNDKSTIATEGNTYRSRSSLDDITCYSTSDKANIGANRKRSSSSSASGVWVRTSHTPVLASYPCLEAGYPKQAEEKRARFARSRGQVTNGSNRSVTPSPLPTESSILPLLISVRQIQAELEFLTQRTESTDAMESQRNDWKFASMVIDRLCLISFSIFIILTTCGVLFSAPHLVA